MKEKKYIIEKNTNVKLFRQGYVTLGKPEPLQELHKSIIRM